MTAPRITCPTCAGTGNHTLGGGRDNAKDVCAACGGEGFIDPGTGQSRAASADPRTGEASTRARDLVPSPPPTDTGLGVEEIADTLWTHDNPGGDHGTWAEWVAYALKHPMHQADVNRYRSRAHAVLALLSARTPSAEEIVSSFRSGRTQGAPDPKGSDRAGHEQSQPAAVSALRVAINSRIVAWLEDRVQDAEEAARAHPEGHRSRTFYDAQGVAYENALSFVASLPADPQDAGR